MLSTNPLNRNSVVNRVARPALAASFNPSPTASDVMALSNAEQLELRSNVFDGLGHSIPTEEFSALIAAALDVKWIDLVRSPQKGSVIAFMSNHKNRTKTSVQSYMWERLSKDVSTLWMSSDTPLDLYILYRLVCPHPVAVTVSDYLQKHVLAKGKMDVLKLIGELSEVDVSNRTDLRKVFGRVTQYHPAIGDWILDVFKVKL